MVPSGKHPKQTSIGSSQRDIPGGQYPVMAPGRQGTVVDFQSRSLPAVPIPLAGQTGGKDRHPMKRFPRTLALVLGLMAIPAVGWAAHTAISSGCCPFC